MTSDTSPGISHSHLFLVKFIKVVCLKCCTNKPNNIMEHRITHKTKRVRARTDSWPLGTHSTVRTGGASLLKDFKHCYLAFQWRLETRCAVPLSIHSLIQRLKVKYFGHRESCPGKRKLNNSVSTKEMTLIRNLNVLVEEASGVRITTFIEGALHV